MTLVPDRIRWYDDMLVTTRHIDAVSARLEGLVQAIPARWHPFPWGVASLEAVAVDQFVAVQRLEAVMPDGVPAIIEPGRTELELDLRPFLGSGGSRRVLVHLATPLDGRASETAPRFVLDATGSILGDDAVPAEPVRRRLLLIAGEVPPAASYASFPLLEVSVEQTVVTLTDFVPPLLQVEASHPLARRAAIACERLRREVAALVDSIHASGPPFAAEVRAQVNPVIAALPPFEVLIASRPHPLALYVELCRVAAAAASLRNHAVPPVFPPYQHLDPRAVFDPVLRFVHGQAEVSTRGSSAWFDFEHDGRWFRLPPDPGWTDALLPGAERDLVLAAHGLAGDAQAEQWGMHCVIASRSAFGSQLTRRVLGANRRRMRSAGTLPLGPDVHLLRLDPDPEIVKPGEDLLVLGDVPGITPSALTLYVVAREGTSSDGATF